MAQAPTDLRRYEARARTTDVFGRVLCSAREQHYVVDGPVQNGCPGEAVTPAELFLSAVAACSVELVQVIARELGAPLASAHAMIEGVVNRAAPVRPDLTLFNAVLLTIELRGVSAEQGTDLVERFKRRCPLFGTVAAATPDVQVEVRTAAA